MDLHVLQGHSCFTMGCTRGWRGISAPMSGTFPSLPSPLPLVSAGLFPSHILIPLFSGCKCFCTIIFCFLLVKYVISELLPASLVDSPGQRWILPSASWHWLCHIQGKLYQLFRTATLYSSQNLATPSCYKPSGSCFCILDCGKKVGKQLKRKRGWVN